MNEIVASIAGLSTGTVVVLVLLGILELGLMVWAIIDIVQRPAVLWGRKWLWLVIVILFGLIGPLVYLALGRVQPPVPEAESDATPMTDRAGRTADLLYGPRPDALSEQATAPADQSREPAPPPPPSPPDETPRD